MMKNIIINWLSTCVKVLLFHIIQKTTLQCHCQQSLHYLQVQALGQRKNEVSVALYGCLPAGGYAREPLFVVQNTKSLRQPLERLRSRHDSVVCRRRRSSLYAKRRQL